MRIVAVVCNVLFWLFYCMVMVTEGPPQGRDILFSLLPFFIPILNIVVIRILSSPGRRLKFTALVCNILWLGLSCWLLAERYPSHPKEAGLLEYAALVLLTPVLSAIAIYLSLISDTWIHASFFSTAS